MSQSGMKNAEGKGFCFEVNVRVCHSVSLCDRVAMPRLLEFFNDSKSSPKGSSYNSYSCCSFGSQHSLHVPCPAPARTASPFVVMTTSSVAVGGDGLSPVRSAEAARDVLARLVRLAVIAVPTSSHGRKLQVAV